MKVLLVLSVLTWALVQNTAGNLLEVGGGGYGYYPPYQPPIQPIPPPIQPIQPIQPVQPVQPLQPNLCEVGAAAQLPGACNCQGYSIQICPFAIESEAIAAEEEVIEQHKIAEIIDVKLVDEVTGEILGEEVEEFDVTGQFYPYGPSYGRVQYGGATGFFPPQFNRFPPAPAPPPVYYGAGQAGYLGGAQGGYLGGAQGGYLSGAAPGYIGGTQGGVIGGFGIQPPYLPGASRSLDD